MALLTGQIVMLPTPTIHCIKAQQIEKMPKRGYTLLELLFVVIVLAVLTAVAVPRLGLDWTVKMKVKTEAQRLIADLRLTRSLAVTNNENHKLSVDSANNEYNIYDSSEAQVGITRSIDSDITISADKDFIFEPLGNAAAASAPGISLSRDSHRADISITVATGRIGVSGP